MTQHYLYEETKVQEFRDADADGAVGMRGYLEYFQDAAASYMHRFGWGNDTVHERYGVAWVYTKYRMQLFEKTVYDHPLKLECWIEPTGRSIAVKHALEISKEGRLLARGRLESCIIDINKQRISRLETIGYDPVLALERENGTDDFTRIEQRTEGMEEAYSRRVRYSDLDNNAHMNNLRYIPLLLDAFSPDYHGEHLLRDLEIHYRKQCLYDELLSVCREEEEEGVWRMLVLKEDGNAAVCARLRFEKT